MQPRQAQHIGDLRGALLELHQRGPFRTLVAHPFERPGDFGFLQRPEQDFGRPLAKRLQCRGMHPRRHDDNDRQQRVDPANLLQQPHIVRCIALKVTKDQDNPLAGNQVRRRITLSERQGVA